MTYMVNLDAKIAIWVAPEIRPEHQRVIDWLNESTGEDFSFYIIRIEAVKISDSPYAPLFTVLAGPDEQIKEIGETKKELAEGHRTRLRFWTEFLERSLDRTQLFANKSPYTDYWLGVGAGKSGVNLNCLIFKDGAAIEMYIDTENQEINKKIFDSLQAHQATIENEFGTPLDWQRLDEKRASRIRISLQTHSGGINQPEKWATLQDIMIDTAIKFDEVFRRRLRNINV